MTQEARRIRARLWAMSAPHSGVGGWAPSPRKLRAAASRMAEAKLKVVCTISGPMQFGRIATKMIRRSRAPMARAAVT